MLRAKISANEHIEDEVQKKDTRLRDQQLPIMIQVQTYISTYS